MCACAINQNQLQRSREVIQKSWRAILSIEHSYFIFTSLTTFIIISYVIIMRASKLQHVPKAKRTKFLWVTIDGGDLTVQEYEVQRTYLCFSQNLCNKSNCRCNLHSRLPECPVRTRSFILPDVSKTIEQKSERNHTCKIFSY